MVKKITSGSKRLGRRNLRNGLLFISPWIIGFLALQVYPIGYSFYLSLTEYNGFGIPKFIGLQNFREAMSDPILPTTISNTLYYTAFAVPIGLVVALLMALAMNQKVREVAVYRAILYLPSILPAFALVFVWLLFANPQYGLLNILSVKLGFPIVDWIGDYRFTKPSIIILAQYGAGGSALIFLASLHSISKELYESAQIDGAGAFRKFFRITLPMLTPVILYLLILGLSAGLQVFTQAYIISGGARGGTIGSQNSLYFYVLYIYRNAFTFSRMGYAAALSVYFFVVSLFIALTVLRWGKSWVNYDT
jgi:multiple sugar transport system permease protein